MKKMRKIQYFPYDLTGKKASIKDRKEKQLLLKRKRMLAICDKILENTTKTNENKEDFQRKKF